MYQGTELVGELLEDREAFDERDRQRWEPVYNILLQEQGGWKLTNPATAVPTYMGRDTENKMFALGLSMLYAIITSKKNTNRSNASKTSWRA